MWRRKRLVLFCIVNSLNFIYKIFNKSSFVRIHFLHFVGDPTTFGNLQPADEVLNAMKKVIDDGNYNGYGPAVGFIEARQAVVNYSLHQGEDITANDVILCESLEKNYKFEK